MNKLFSLIVILTISFSESVLSSPKINFKELLIRSELSPSEVLTARELAVRQSLPVNILTTNRIVIDAKGIEDGKIVYTVINNFADPFNGGYAAFYEDLVKVFDPSSSRIDYGSGYISDHTGRLYDPANC